MISQVDDALRSLVRDALEGAEAEVVFDAPTKDWAARRNAPTVNLYLYDLREDLRRRERGFRETYGEDGAVIGRIPAPRHFRLSYLVTAWTQRPEDEHRLLDSVLRRFLRHEFLPDDVVTGQLGEAGMAVPVYVGLPPPEDRGFADVWTALGGELKPSLDVVVVAPMLTGVTLEVGPPVRAPMRVDLSDFSRDAAGVRRGAPSASGTPAPGADRSPGDRTPGAPATGPASDQKGQPRPRARRRK